MNFPTFAAVLLGACTVCGCATPTLPQLQSSTLAMRAQRSTIAAEPATLAMLLTEPVDADRAVRVALVNNPASRALLAQLQVRQGDLYDALRPGNPTVAFSSDNVWSVTQPLLDLLFSGYRRKHGELVLREAQQLAADQLLRLERDVRQGWLGHAAAALRADVARRDAEAADLAAELAAQYHTAGNLPELALRTAQAAAGVAHLHSAAREAQRLTARTTLLELLGLPHDQPQLDIAERLQLPVHYSPDAESLAAQAQQQRLDLTAARAAVEIAQRENQHTRHWRWLPYVAVSYEGGRESDQERHAGPGVVVQLPLPNTGAGRRARAAAQLAQRELQLAALQVAVRNRVIHDSAQLALARQAFEVHARAVLAAEQRTVELRSAEHNFMLIGSLELLAARRQQIASYDLWIDAVESWWRAFNGLAYESGVALPIPAATSYVAVENLP